MEELIIQNLVYLLTFRGNGGEIMIFRLRNCGITNPTPGWKENLKAPKSKAPGGMSIKRILCLSNYGNTARPSISKAGREFGTSMTFGIKEN